MKLILSLPALALLVAVEPSIAFSFAPTSGRASFTTTRLHAAPIDSTTLQIVNDASDAAARAAQLAVEAAAGIGAAPFAVATASVFSPVAAAATTTTTAFSTSTLTTAKATTATFAPSLIDLAKDTAKANVQPYTPPSIPAVQPGTPSLFEFFTSRSDFAAASSFNGDHAWDSATAGFAQLLDNVVHLDLSDLFSAVTDPIDDGSALSPALQNLLDDFDPDEWLDLVSWDDYGTYYVAVLAFAYGVQQKQLGKDEATRSAQVRVDEARARADAAAALAVEAAASAATAKDLCTGIRDEEQESEKGDKLEAIITDSKVKLMELEKDDMKRELKSLTKLTQQLQSEIKMLQKMPLLPTPEPVAPVEPEPFFAETADMIPRVYGEKMAQDPEEGQRILEVLKEIDAENLAKKQGTATAGDAVVVEEVEEETPVAAEEEETIPDTPFSDPIPRTFEVLEQDPGENERFIEILKEMDNDNRRAKLGITKEEEEAEEAAVRAAEEAAIAKAQAEQDAIAAAERAAEERAAAEARWVAKKKADEARAAEEAEEARVAAAAQKAEEAKVAAAKQAEEEAREAAAKQAEEEAARQATAQAAAKQAEDEAQAAAQQAAAAAQQAEQEEAQAVTSQQAQEEARAVEEAAASVARAVEEAKAAAKAAGLKASAVAKVAAKAKADEEAKVVAVTTTTANGDDTQQQHPWSNLAKSTLSRKTVVQLSEFLTERGITSVDGNGKKLPKKELLSAVKQCL